MAQGPFRLAEIVGRLGGELVGDPAIEVRGVATLRSAQAGDLAFLVQASTCPTWPRRGPRR